MRRVTVPPRCSQLVAIAADITEDDTRTLLSGKERDERDTLRPDKRRVEWTAARVATKLLAVERRIVDDPQRCTVDKIASRPRLLIEGVVSELNVSISHSSAVGASAIHDSPVGVDIQDIRAIDPRAAKFFLGDEESNVLTDLAARHPLLHLWCAKEAAWKASADEGSTLKAVTLRMIRSEGGGGLFEYTVGGRRGTVETYVVEQRLVLAIATERKYTP